MGTTNSNINYNNLSQSGKLKFDDNGGNDVVSYTYNLVNIIPNPLYNNYINEKFNNESYITSDFNGLENTSYLLYSHTNIVNNIRRDMYLPAIGELSVAIENISLINAKIREVCDKYKEMFPHEENNYDDYIISYNTTIPSSSLYSPINKINNMYTLENGINNVWCINTEYGKISYVSTSSHFNILPFYVYK